jgi:hypothetical protein
MRTLSFEAFRKAAADFDATVAESRLPDPFCTSSDWVLPARAAFSQEVEPFVCHAPEGWVPLMRMETVLGRTLLPLEASWGLAAPFVGVDRNRLALRFMEYALTRRSEWDAMFLSGLVRNGADFDALVRRLARKYRLGLGQATLRCVASLDGGLDGFLGRRTRRFRKNLRNAERRASGTLRFEVLRDVDIDGVDEVFAQILAVESLSWKAVEGHGIVDGPMRDFYAVMTRRLARRGALRVTFAWEGDRRVGYVMGGLFEDTYRGLQISFDQRLAAMSPGNLMQLATVTDLVEHDGTARYDLGTDMPYKRGWAEELVETVPLVVR